MNRCGANIEGPRQPGTRSAVLWRGSCKAWPMKDPGIDGYNPLRCFQHQSPEVRAEIYRRRAA